MFAKEGLGLELKDTRKDNQKKNVSKKNVQQVQFFHAKKDLQRVR